MSLNKVDTMQRAYKRADAYTDGNWVDETNFNRHLYGSFRSSCCEVTAGGAHIPPTQKHAGRVLIGNWVEDSIPSQNGTARNILTNGWNVDTPPPTSTYRDSYKGPDTSSMTAQSLRERVLGVRAQQRLENVIEKSREHGHLDLAAQRERCQSTLSETQTTSFGETFGRRSRAGFDATKELPAVAPVFTYQTDQAITCAKQNPNCGCVMKVQGTTVPSREADFVKNVSFTTPPQITMQRRVI